MNIHHEPTSLAMPDLNYEEIGKMVVEHISQWEECSSDSQKNFLLFELLELAVDWQKLRKAAKSCDESVAQFLTHSSCLRHAEDDISLRRFCQLVHEFFSDEDDDED